MKFTPMGQCVLIRRAERPKQTASGLHIPESSQERPQQGFVVALGSGLKDRPFSVKVGDEIFLPRMGGTDITLEGVGCIVFAEADLLGIVTRE